MLRLNKLEERAILGVVFIKMNSEKKKNSFIFGTEDFILYILNHLEPDKSDKIRLNKIAFLIEFAYISLKERYLSRAKYAAIDNGAVIDSYKSILDKMEKKDKIKIDGYFVRPLQSQKISVPEEVSSFLNPLIEKYSALNNRELINLSHSTDSYKITTDNDRRMGGIIDKKLALLETFFVGDEVAEVGLNEEKLPVINRKKLVEYEFKAI